MQWYLEGGAHTTAQWRVGNGYEPGKDQAATPPQHRQRTATAACLGLHGLQERSCQRMQKNENKLALMVIHTGRSSIACCEGGQSKTGRGKQESQYVT